MTTTAAPPWTLKGDWFDVCSCSVPCPCTFAQSPTGDKCTAMFAYRIAEGDFGGIPLGGLNVAAVVRLTGNVWNGDSLATVGLLLDAKADDEQQQALTAIFGGAAGGWPAQFASLIGDFRGIEVVPITIDIAEDLSWWRVEATGKFSGSATALTGPTADPNKRVQLINAPGSETGPAEHLVATWASGYVRQADPGLFGDFDVMMVRASSKHIPFDWSGPDA